MYPKAIRIRAPHDFAGNIAVNSALDQSPENQWERVIQPDDDLGTSPRYRDGSAVVPGNDPSLAVDCFDNFGDEFLVRCADPIRLPVEGIQFDKIQIQEIGELFG